MTTKVDRFFGKVFATLIQYTIGLVLPWWLLNSINKALIESYTEKFLHFGKLHRYTYGIILPWWLLYAVGKSNSKSQKEVINEGETSVGNMEKSAKMFFAQKANKSERKSKEKNFYCTGCGMHVTDVRAPVEKHGKCPEKEASNWSHHWTDMGYVGKYKSSCQLCGITVYHDSQFLHSMKCFAGSKHKWKQHYN